MSARSVTFSRLRMDSLIVSAVRPTFWVENGCVDPICWVENGFVECGGRKARGFVQQNAVAQGMRADLLTGGVVANGMPTDFFRSWANPSSRFAHSTRGLKQILASQHTWV